MNNLQLLELVRRKYSSISKSLEQSLLDLDDPEDLVRVAGDLDKLPTVHHLAGMLEWIEGRHAGRIEGLRDAVYLLLRGRMDEAAEEIEEAAFESFDVTELEELLLRAARLAPELAATRN